MAAIVRAISRKRQLLGLPNRRKRREVELPEHSHPHEQVILVDHGELEMTVSGRTTVLKPGDMIVIPPDAVHSGTALTELDTTDVFSPVREDYRGSFERTVLEDARAREAAA
jgi:mannose-6-phosphate isomerase-like protein (cupin superfamily)